MGLHFKKLNAHKKGVCLTMWKMSSINKQKNDDAAMRASCCGSNAARRDLAE